MSYRDARNARILRGLHNRWLEPPDFGPDPCTTCDDEHWLRCESCEGEGSVQVDGQWVTCEACDGQEGSDCPDCECPESARDRDDALREDAYEARQEREMEL